MNITCNFQIGPVDVPLAPLENVLFHPKASVQKWKCVCQKKIACEIECSQEAMECNEIMDFLVDVGL